MSHFDHLDDEILNRISADPDDVEEFLDCEKICPPHTLSTEQLRRIGSAMYTDGDLWQAHAAALLKALDTVAPHVRLEAKLRKAVDSAWFAILSDIDDGRVPAEVGTFSRLHDFVDANMYLIDAAEEHGIKWGTGDFLPGDPPDDWVDPLNIISDRLDAMLRDRVGDPPEGFTASLSEIFGKAVRLAAIVDEPGLASEIRDGLRAIINAQRGA